MQCLHTNEHSTDNNESKLRESGRKKKDLLPTFRTADFI